MLRLFKQLYTIRNLFFIIAEACFIFISVIISSRILMSSSFYRPDNWLNFKASIITLVCIICLYYNSVYDISITKKYSELGIRLMQSFGTALIILAGIYAVFQDAIICRGFFIIYVPIVMSLIAIWRFIYILVLKKGLLNDRIMLLGSGEITQGIINTIYEQIDCGFTLVAVADDNDSNSHIDFDDSQIERIMGYENLYTKGKYR
jgi:FlaA1/EpsC-like NDP-sugar epimerase